MNQNKTQSGFFAYKKYTSLCGEEFTAQKFSISQVPHKFPSLLREYKLWVTCVMYIYSFKTNVKLAS